MAPQHCLRRLKSPPERSSRLIQKRRRRVEFLGFMKRVTAAFPGPKLHVIPTPQHAEEQRALAQAPPQCAISFHASSAARCLAFIHGDAQRSEMERRDELSGRDTPSYPRRAPNGNWQWISVRPFGTLFELMLLEINEGTSRRVMTHVKKRWC